MPGFALARYWAGARTRGRAAARADNSGAPGSSLLQLVEVLDQAGQEREGSWLRWVLDGR